MENPLGRPEDSLADHQHQQALQSKLQNLFNMIPQGRLLHWPLFPFRLFLVRKDSFFTVRKKMTSQKSLCLLRRGRLLGRGEEAGIQCNPTHYKKKICRVFPAATRCSRMPNREMSFGAREHINESGTMERRSPSLSWVDPKRDGLEKNTLFLKKQLIGKESNRARTLQAGPLGRETNRKMLPGSGPDRTPLHCLKRSVSLV